MTSASHPLSAGAPERQEMQSESKQELLATAETADAVPLPLRSSPRSARIGKIKTGGRVFVLDHSRWTAPMTEAIDGLLQKFHGQKDMLKLVDQQYADLVYRAATDPNSLLHPTTRQHISRYIKHRAKLINASSSLNTSPEKLLETQQLWHSLTEGSKTASVPVVTIEPVRFNPPATSSPTPMTQESIEKIVQDVLKQQQQQSEQKQRQTKNCLACGQPKSRYGTDGSSVHYFFQQGPVRYFYCSKKVHNIYAAEGLSNPKMSFEDFSSTQFFQRELEDTKKRVEEKTDKKRKRPDSQQPGRLCRFCRMVLKQGPDSPHIHTSFPGLAGKYIYCPSKVHALYQHKGMTKEMSWKDFCKSPFFEEEKQRWVQEKKR
ncbi:uncharacterized protein [Leuresthes tenuis]|uniref:uncharacterized protein n=1 Tax=Leuresthes tenuis TaxID=355514 RepID=UPI003B502A86